MEGMSLSTVRKVSMAGIQARVNARKLQKQNPIDTAYARELAQIRRQKADSVIISKLSPATAMDRVKDKIQVAVNMMTGNKKN